MNKIKSFSIFRTRSVLAKPIADSTHVLTEISFIVLRINLENGTDGEAYLLSFHYSPEAIVGALKDHGELLIGHEVS